MRRPRSAQPIVALDWQERGWSVSFVGTGETPKIAGALLTRCSTIYWPPETIVPSHRPGRSGGRARVRWWDRNRFRSAWIAAPSQHEDKPCARMTWEILGVGRGLSCIIQLEVPAALDDDWRGRLRSGLREYPNVAVAALDTIRLL